MATVKQRLQALEQEIKPKEGQRMRPERVRYIGELMRGERLDVFSLERIEAAKIMLESHL